MALPTTTNDVTTRRLGTAISSLWTKIKNTFQTIGNKVTSWSSTPSDTKYPSEKLVKDALDGKESLFDSLYVRYNAAGNGWVKLADIGEKQRGSLDINCVWDVVLTRADGGLWSETLVLSVRYQGGEGSVPELKTFNRYAKADKSDYFKFAVKIIGVSYQGTTNVELWGYVPRGWNTIGIREAGAGTSSMSATRYWNYYSYNTEGGGSKPEADAAANIQVFDPIQHTDISGLDIDDALSTTSTNPVQNQELTRWHNIIIGEDGYVSGSSANPQLSLQKSRLGSLSLYNAGVNIKIYSFDENNEANATLEWDVSTASDSVKALYNKGEQTGTLYQSTAGKWVKIVYTGTTACYFRALGVFMDTKDTSSTVSNFYGHLRIGGVDYPESAQFSTWGSLVVAAYSKSSVTTVELILRPKSATCACRIFGFRCLNTYTGSDAVLIGCASSAMTLSETLPISKGGTGATTANDAANALLSGLPSWAADPTDSVRLIRRDTGGTASFGQVTFATVWNYIKGKISSVLGLSESNGVKTFTGNAATATTAQNYDTSTGTIKTALEGKVAKSGDTMTGKLVMEQPITQVITGTGTVGTSSGSPTTYYPAKWDFDLGIANPTPGDRMVIQIPVAGHDNGVFLSTDNGTTYYPVARSTSTYRLTTHYPAKAYICVVFEAYDGTDGCGKVGSIYPVTGGTARETLTTGCWRVINDYDSGNNYERLYTGGYFYAGSTGCNPYSLVCMDNTGKFSMLISGGSGTGTSKTVNTTSKFTYPATLMYYAANNTAAANARVSSASAYIAYPGFDCRYSCNYTTTFATHSATYIECTLNSDNTWTPTSNSITQTLRSGYYYIYLGNTTSTTYSILLHTNHPILYYDGTNLISAELTISSLSASSTNGSISVAGTDVSVYTHPTQTAYSAKGSATKVPKITTDSTGHVTSIEEVTITGVTPASHSHGNIANGGTLTDTAAAAAGNDYVVIRDADNAKIQTSTIKGTDVADAVSKKHSHSTLTLSTTAQAYDGTHTLALPASDPYTSARTPASHTHGNIANGGTLTDTAAAAAGNDYVVIRDADNAKIQTSTIKGTDVADAVTKKHEHTSVTLSTTAQAYDGTHTLALPASDPYTSARTPSSHTHGNIQNGGTLQSTDITIASGDKLVVTDSSDSNKVARASVSFDGATTTTALTPKGTFEVFAKSGDITSAINALDAEITSTDGTNVQAKVTETNGKITAVNITTDNTAYKEDSVYYVAGTTDYAAWVANHAYAVNDEVVYGGKAYKCSIAHTSGSSFDSGKWSAIATPVLKGAISDITALYTGMKIAYKWPITGGSSSTYLNINGLGNVYIRRNDGNTTTHLPMNAVCILTYDGTYWRWADYDSGNTYDRTYTNAGKFTAGATGCNPYAIVCLDAAGKYSMLISAGSGTGTSKTINTTGKFSYPTTVLYYNANNTVAANTVVSSGYATYISFPNIDIRYSTNYGTTSNPAFTTSKPVYIECTLNGDGTWSPTEKAITQTLATGKYYIYLGISYSTAYQLSLATSHPMLYYDGTNLVSADLARGDITASSTNGNINVAGTDVTIYTHPTTEGNKHIPSGGSSGQYLAWDSAGTAKWVSNPNSDTKVKATAKTDNVNYKILATASASPTSGNATEAVYDTDITLNPSTNTIAASISGNAATATSAGKLTTARKTYVTLGTASTTTTRDWSGDTTIPVDGTLGVGNGGTGKSSVTSNSFLVGNGSSAMVEKTPAEVLSLIGAQATITYMTTDQENSIITELGDL